MCSAFTNFKIMKVLEFLKGKQISIHNEIENKETLLTVDYVKELIKEEMLYDKDGWELGKHKKIKLGFLVVFTNGYKKKYSDIMNIDFHKPNVDELNVEEFS